MIRFALLPLFVAPLLGQSWYEVLTTSDPGDMRDAAMAFSPVSNNVILFGGFPTLNGTWLYDGSDWTNAAPATVPTGRREFAMATDTARGVVVMFGGRGPTGALADTWEWNGVDWQNVTPAISPPARIGHVMAYDAVRGVSVLFGGANDPFVPPALSDTWHWDGATWTQVQTTTAPSESLYSSMCYDSGRSVCVLTGGTSTGGGPDQRTWEYDGIDWVDRTAAVGPGPGVGIGVQNAQMVYVPLRQVSVLYGGRTPGGTLPTDTWEDHGASWTISATSTPSERVRFAMTFDAARGVPVLYGGLDGSFQNWLRETWENGFGPASYVVFGSGCPGSVGTPTNSASSLPVLGNTLTIDIGQMPSPEIMAIVLGASRIGPIDLSPIGAPNCLGYVSPDFLSLVGGVGGIASFQLPVPASVGLLGVQVHSQALVFDGPANALGGVFSDAATATVGI